MMKSRVRHPQEPNDMLKRLFVAIPFRPEAGFAEKQAILRGCTCRTDRVNWVSPELLHITLKFLGGTDTGRIPSLCGALEEVAHGEEPFTIVLDRIGAFGSRYQPRAVWLGASEPPEGVLRLHGRMEKLLGRIGFPRTFGNFVCHMTLARINHLDSKPFFWNRLDACQTLFSERLEVREFILYESILRKGAAPVYEVLEKFPLTKLQ